MYLNCVSIRLETYRSCERNRVEHAFKFLSKVNLSVDDDVLE